MNGPQEIPLFGPSAWEVPWHQYDATEPKQVNDTVLNFLHSTIGLEGEQHPCHGWIVDMNQWAALRKYIQWCNDSSVDFLYHAEKVECGDVGYTGLATNMMNAFFKDAKAVK